MPHWWDNLGATLDAARQDALYSQVLFLFLGLPGVALSAVLATVITAGGAARRRYELGLLRARGAGGGQLTAVAGTEAMAVGLIGGVVGAGAGVVVDHVVLGSPVSLSWLLSAAAAGVVLTAVTVLTPALRDLRFSTAYYTTRRGAVDFSTTGPQPVLVPNFRVRQRMISD
ncbi:FtsX-like permease family protein [Rhodococcus sp. ACS1]|uniref:FtsX-like permease family protein n=1 Tax=Rhodococcus sp. ACS1 TaxID=2028570 RepID=UPI00211BB1F0|nr:FtsX-like permease family protein [Rhodococcus sp. ACS1]